MKIAKNKIIVPIDFSDHAYKAVEIATEIANAWNAQLILLHVIDIPTYEGVDDKLNQVFLQSVKTEAKNRLDKWAEQGSNKQASTKILMGHVGVELLQFIKKENVALVVLGSKLYKQMDEMLAGSALERILRHAQCPVLTVKESKKISDIKNIVFATDFKSTHTLITTQLKRIQELSGATIHILKVNTRENWQNDEEAEKQMSDFNDIHNFKNFHFHVSNSETIEAGIIHYYQFIYADMIAMSIHSLNEVAVSAGNYFITEKVLQNMPSLLWTCIQGHSDN
jgi:nucleotide-binding universal stress UspA family protein